MTHIPNVRPGALTGLGGGAPLIPTDTTHDVEALAHVDVNVADLADVLAVPIAYTEDDDENGEPGRSYSEWLPASIDPDVLDELLAGVDPDGTASVLIRLRDDGLIEVRAVPEGEPDGDEGDERPAPAEPDDTYAATYPFDGTVDAVAAWAAEGDSEEQERRRAYAVRMEQRRDSPRKTVLALGD